MERIVVENLGELARGMPRNAVPIPISLVIAGVPEGGCIGDAIRPPAFEHCNVGCWALAPSATLTDVHLLKTKTK
jgi:hypothetical protein